MRPALTFRSETFEETMLILTALLTAAAMVYLTYAMIRPERF